MTKKQTNAIILIIISVPILILGLYIGLKLADYRLKQFEKWECEEWQRQIDTNPIFTNTEAEVLQCEALGIPLSR